MTLRASREKPERQAAAAPCAVGHVREETKLKRTEMDLLPVRASLLVAFLNL
jgi:hypothetical protein